MDVVSKLMDVILDYSNPEHCPVHFDALNFRSGDLSTLGPGINYAESENSLHPFAGYMNPE